MNFTFIRRILQYFFYYKGFYFLKASYFNSYSKEFNGIFTGEHDERKINRLPLHTRVNSLSVILARFHFYLPRTVPIIIFVQLEIKLECVFHKMFDA